MADEARTRQVYERDTLEHPLEAETLAVRDIRRKHNSGAQRGCQSQKAALVAGRQSRHAKEKLEMSSHEEPLDGLVPDEATMKALLDHMDSAGLW